MLNSPNESVIDSSVKPSHWNSISWFVTLDNGSEASSPLAGLSITIPVTTWLTKNSKESVKSVSPIETRCHSCF